MDDGDAKLSERRMSEWLSKRRCSVIERAEFDISIIKDKPVLWITGPAGAGKGTQCAKLHARYGFTHLSSGELMRHEVLEGTSRSKFLCELMKNGNPVPNSMVIEVIAQAMVALAKESKGFVIDGFPLDEEQASEFVKEFGPPSLVLHIDCPARILRQRLQERNNYDDSKDTVENRLKLFKEVTKPMLEKYKATTINSNKDKDEVFGEIEALLLKTLGLKAHSDE